MSDRELLQQLRNALNHAIRSHFPPRWDNTEPVLGYKSLIAAADAHLAKPVWIRVEDALPVVPEGDAERCTLLIEWRPPAPVSGTGEGR